MKINREFSAKNLPGQILLPYPNVVVGFCTEGSILPSFKNRSGLYTKGSL